MKTEDNMVEIEPPMIESKIEDGNTNSPITLDTEIINALITKFSV